MAACFCTEKVDSHYGVQLTSFLKWLTLFLKKLTANKQLFPFCKQYVYEAYKYSLEGANISLRFFKTKRVGC